MIKRIAAAFEFLTIIPLPFNLGGVGRVSNIGKSSAVFPVVGLIVGSAYAIFFYVLRYALPVEACAVAVIMVETVITGGLHLDGVSDTFDAIASRKTPAERLVIMKSGAAGPIGAAAVALTLLMKYSLLKYLLSHPQISGTFVLLCYPAVGRFAATASMFTGRSAKSDGLGWLFIKQTNATEFMTAAALTFIIVTSLNMLGGGVALSSSFHSLVLVIIISVAAKFSGIFFKRHLGGITGDTMGAFIEFAELTFLLYLTAGGHICRRAFI